MKFAKAPIARNLDLDPKWFLIKTPCLSKKSIMRLWSILSKSLLKTGRRDIGLELFGFILFRFYKLVLLWLLLLVLNSLTILLIFFISCFEMHKA